MSKINYTYGILTGGAVPTSSMWYRNCKNIAYTCHAQKAAMAMLWGKDRSNDAIGCGADIMLRLIQCSDLYPEYVKEYDSVNTYSADIVSDSDIVVPEDCITMRDLTTWADSLLVNSSDYPVLPTMPPIERIINTIFCILTMRG